MADHKIKANSSHVLFTWLSEVLSSERTDTPMDETHLHSCSNSLTQQCLPLTVCEIGQIHLENVAAAAFEIHDPCQPHFSGYNWAELPELR